MSSPPQAIGVIGGGRMGTGIAQAFSSAGSDVVLVERNEEEMEAARERIIRGLQRAAEHQSGDRELDGMLDRIRFATDPAALPASVQLVVEAVPEQIELKTSVLAAAESAISDGSVLATNTSSLSIAVLGASLRRPERFVGMHFFNPVPGSRLVEVVIGPDTSDAVRDRVVSWIHALGKSEVVVNDSPGFATTRLGVLLGLEAIRMLEEEVADAETIDRAMQLGYRHAVGPLYSTDLVGLDVRLSIAEYLHRTLGERFAPPQLLRDKVARGELGRKTGRGFHDYEGPRPEAEGSTDE